MAVPKNLGGRPLAFKSVEELQEKIDEYFQHCDNRAVRVWDEKTKSEKMVLNPAPYTMSGLAYFLGVDRDTIINYSHKEAYFGTITRARDKVHADVEERLMDTKNERGAMFSLKNNFGWKEKQETDVTSGGKRMNIGVISYDQIKKDE